MEKLLEELENYRLENKLSQKKLAEKLDISFATVFKGRNKPNKIQTYHIQKLLDIHKLKDTHFELS